MATDTARHSRAVAAIVAGALCMMWPALMNGYPLLFSDTGPFMEQLLLPFMVWDKPWIYGPVMVVTSLRVTLWLPVLGQALLLSWMLWFVQSVFWPSSPVRQLMLCALLALTSAASWFASLLMPDILAPLTVLTLFCLAFDPLRRRRLALIALATFAIAAHLTHLIIAAACLATVLLIRPRAFVATAVPLAAAIALLITTNLVGHGRPGISPYGAVFGLARLVADGPARVWLDEDCPDERFRLCAWKGRLPSDADVFLWDPSGPVWTFPGGPIALAPEASRIVTASLLAYPMAAARAGMENWLAQLVTVRLREVIAAKGLDATVGTQLHAHYPPAEELRYQASVQRTGGLAAIAAPWQNVHVVMLVLVCISCIPIGVWSWRNDRVLFGLIALITTGLFSNGFATGVLSGPHDRYQARIVWLVLLPPGIFAARWGHRRWVERSPVR